MPTSSRLKFIGTPTNPVWVDNAPHRFKIVVSSKTTGIELGESEPFKLITKDPCDNAVIIP